MNQIFQNLREENNFPLLIPNQIELKKSITRLQKFIPFNNFRRDTIKEEIVCNAGFKYLVFLESDPYTDPVFIRERWLDEIEDVLHPL